MKPHPVQPLLPQAVAQIHLRPRPGPAVPLLALTPLLTLLAGCVGVSTPGERQSRRDQEFVEQQFRPAGQRPVLPRLDPSTPLQDFLLFAVLNHPQVEATYFDWVASVRRITVERSLPDPRLTFQADITNMVMSLMPGLMMEFPGPGKLRAAADVATAESEGRYFAFEWSVLQTAFTLRKAYYELHFLEARIGVNQATLALMGEVERLARTRNEVGQGSLQDVLRAQIEQERLTTEIANLEDSRLPLTSQFKAALGLEDSDHTPPLPRFESTRFDLSSDQLLASAVARNPRLRAMEAEVRRADASLRLAYQGRIPDFSAGLMVDVKSPPYLFRPQAGMTLPIWRDKIAAQIAAAQAGKRSAEARLNSDQIMLAVGFAEKSFLYREAQRTQELLIQRLLPKAGQSLAVAQSGFISGKLDFLNLLDAERTLLEFQLAEVEARVQRELALSEIFLLIAGNPPDRAPVLPPRTTPVKERYP